MLLAFSHWLFISLIEVSAQRILFYFITEQQLKRLSVLSSEGGSYKNYAIYLHHFIAMTVIKETSRFVVRRW
jgi:hypothetical protein